MKKPKVNFLKDIKKAVTGLFKKKKGKESSADYSDRYHQEEDLFETLSGNEDEENYNVDDEDFVPQELSIEELKMRNQDEDLPDLPPGGEELPGLPPEESEELPDLPGVRNEGPTSPSLNPMELPKSGNAFTQKIKSASDKVGQFFQDKMPGLKKKFPKMSGGFSSNSAFGKTINNFDWEKFVGGIFSPASRGVIHKGFLGALLVTGTYSVGKLTALALKPKEKKVSKPRVTARPKANFGNQRPLLEKIASSDLFNAQGEQLKTAQTKPDDPRPKTDPNKVCYQAKKASSLPIKLLHTTVLQDSVKSIASVQVRGKKYESIRAGDNLDGMLKVGFIDRLRLIFKNLQTNDCEFIESSNRTLKPKGRPITVVSTKQGRPLLNNKRGGITNTGNNFKISKGEREKMLSNINEILTQARAIQIKNPDGTLSFKMVEVVPDSIYSKLNIQDGDIITGINGKKIKNLNEIMALFGKIRSIDHFELTVKRNGMESNLEYDFE